MFDDITDGMQRWLNQYIFGDEAGYLEDDRHTVGIAVYEVYDYGLLESGVKLHLRYHNGNDETPHYAVIQRIEKREHGGKTYYMIEAVGHAPLCEYWYPVYLLPVTPQEWVLYALLEKEIRINNIEQL